MMKKEKEFLREYLHEFSKLVRPEDNVIDKLILLRDRIVEANSKGKNTQ